MILKMNQKKTNQMEILKKKIFLMMSEQVNEEEEFNEEDDDEYENISSEEKEINLLSNNMKEKYKGLELINIDDASNDIRSKD